MPFVTYEQTKPWAAAIKQAVDVQADAAVVRRSALWQVLQRSIPDTAADRMILGMGRCRRARGLVQRCASAASTGPRAGTFPSPTRSSPCRTRCRLPASGDVEYTYEIVPTGFTEDMWVQMSEIRPSSPEHVHHAVVYIRPPNSELAPFGARRRSVYASNFNDPKSAPKPTRPPATCCWSTLPAASPTAGPTAWRSSFPPARTWSSRCTTPRTAMPRQTRPASGWCSPKRTAEQRVLTLQLTNHSFIIPPRTDDYRVDVAGTLPNDAPCSASSPTCTCGESASNTTSCIPTARSRTLLRVNYHFHWQLSYRLAQPRFLKAGTRLQAVAWYDNSDNNPHNPDPNARRSPGAARPTMR